MRLARRHQRIEHLGHLRHGNVKLPAEFAHIVHAQQPHARNARHRGGLAGQPAEGRIGEVGVRTGCQHLAGQRTGEHQHAEVVGHVGDRHLLIVALAPCQLVKVVELCNSCREHIEMVGRKPCDRDLGFDEAILVEQVTEDDAAILRRDLVGADALEEGVGVLARDLEFGEGRKIHEAHAVTHRKCLFLDRREPVGALEGILLAFAALVVPPRPLPAEDLRELRAFCLQLVIERGLAQPTAHLVLLGGLVAVIHVVIVGDGDFSRIVLGCPFAEAARVELAHVDLGLAVHHPLGEVLAGATALADADRGAAMHPVVLRAMRRARQVDAVRRVGDGARDDRLHARFAEQRQALRGALQPRHDAVELRGFQFALIVPARRLAIPAHMRGGRLVGADEHTVGLLAQIGVGVGVAHNGEFHVEVDQLLQRLGDHIVVQHVGDRHVVPGPGAHHVAVRAGGIHHVLAVDGSLLGEHAPFAIGQQLDVHHPVAAHDLGPQLAGACCHGVGDVGGCHVAVGHRPEGGLDAGGVEEGVILLDLGGSDDLALVARQPRDAVDVFQPVHFLIGAGKAQAAATMPGYGLPGQLFQLRVKLGAVEVHLGHVERAVEMRALARRMPGRTRGQFALLDQDDVRPAFKRQVVEEPHAHHATANNHNTRMRLHNDLRILLHEG